MLYKSLLAKGRQLATPYSSKTIFFPVSGGEACTCLLFSSFSSAFFFILEFGATESSQ